MNLIAMEAVITKICSPPRSTRLSELEIKVTVERNKEVLFTLAILILLLCGIIVYKQSQNLLLINTILVAISWTVVLITFILTCRSYIMIFNLVILLEVFLVPYYLVCNVRTSAIAMWSNQLLFPVLIYYFTDRKSMLLMSILFQMFMAKTQYNYYIEEEILSTSVQSYVKQSEASSIFGIITMGLIISLIKRKTAREYELLMNTETQKIDSENKNMYLFSHFHEFRNILGQIINNISFIDTSNLGEGLKNSIQNVKVCSNNLYYLANSFLDINKVERGKIDITPGFTLSKNFFNEFWGVATSLISKKSLTGNMTISSNLPRSLKIDGYRIFQILLNIISNSVKYTDKGSISLYAEWVPDKSIDDNQLFEPFPFDEDGVFEKKNCIMMHLENSTQYSSVQHGILKISIIDTGSGISDEDLRKVFKKFEQFSPDSNQRRVGIGLGLHISRQLCLLMNGKIRPFSKKGKGTAFIICIPCNSM
jgi:signal transduction histidine kinase